MSRLCGVCVGLLVIVSAVFCRPDYDNVVQMMREREDVPQAKTGDTWALLVAGSNTWYNYRHQADVCHAYQILHKHGIPDERIVVMMYDDIANDKRNPTPGIVINHPNGSDVYKGVVKDYVGKDVTPENFLNILQGNEDAMKGIGSGKVIKSGPDDFVFVNFVDHGAPGLVAFPSAMLKAAPLIEAIKSMHEKQKYNQLVFYLEACESGSMFKDLPSDINVYATTAANATQSSYACYMDKKRMTYLGDVYSVKWMEDSDKENLNKETLHKQYMITKRETNTSHVCQFGDMKMAKDKVAEFQGSKKAPAEIPPPAPLDAVPSDDVTLSILYAELDAARDVRQKDYILNQIKDHLKTWARIAGTMKTIVTMVMRDSGEAERLVSIQHPLNNNRCYDPLVDLFDQKCYRLSEYEHALRQLYALVNMCEEGIRSDVISDVISRVCDGTH